jgi:hypothetical protein
MQVVPAEEEVDAEVRREDQDKINRFARLNARLHELRAERGLIEVRSAWAMHPADCATVMKRMLNYL